MSPSTAIDRDLGQSIDFVPKVSEPLLGTDNLTAQEQIELYGRVYDAKG